MNAAIGTRIPHAVNVNVPSTYRTSPAFSVERRNVVLSDSMASALALTTSFAVSPDGLRFLFSRARNQGLALVLVENWFEELKQKVR